MPRLRRADQILGLFVELELDPLLATFIPFTAAADSYQLIDQRGEDAIQVVLQYED